MAVQVDDAEFWFPAEFLTDDDIIMEKEKLKSKNDGKKNNTESETHCS